MSIEQTLASKIIRFNESLKFEKTLPDGIRVMNPFKSNNEALKVSSEFYRKFYDDNTIRTMILGINPGRHGAGATGIPFTDTKRLKENCSLEIRGLNTHEPSSVFVYKMIEAYGGAGKFYSKFYINSVCPLGFTKFKDGKELNYNYYDNKQLILAVKDFIVTSIRKQIRFGMNTEICYCLGAGKNYEFLEKLNSEYNFFRNIIPLEHPRFIIQYKMKKLSYYIDMYLNELSK